MDGVSLQCENGFSVAEVSSIFFYTMDSIVSNYFQFTACTCLCGSIALLQRSMEGRITQPEDLAAIIDIVEPPQSYVQQLHSFPDHNLSTFGDFIYQFLRSTGWLSLAKADDLRSLTNITDEEIANPGFRSQTFHRAAFNRNLILAGTRIRVSSLSILKTWSQCS